MSRPSDLPDYKQPPVIEVAFSVQYAGDIAGFTMAHAGRFWAELGSEFSTVEEAPPISSTIERADGTIRGVLLGSNLPPSRRLQIRHANDGWIVQIQPDRFLLNWSADRPDAAYPKFDACFKQFIEYRRLFESYCAQSGLNLPLPNQYELTYVNHVPRGQRWDSPADIGLVFPDITWRSDHEFLPTPNTVSWSAIFNMPQNSGRLHASTKVARKQSDNSEVLLLELTARGFPTDSVDEAWFYLAREWIVKGFTDLTDKVIQSDIWERTQ